jgi:hypothetical protein
MAKAISVVNHCEGTRLQNRVRPFPSHQESHQERYFFLGDGLNASPQVYIVRDRRESFGQIYLTLPEVLGSVIDLLLVLRLCKRRQEWELAFLDIVGTTNEGGRLKLQLWVSIVD